MTIFNYTIGQWICLSVILMIGITMIAAIVSVISTFILSEKHDFYKQF